nr:hypothetical protein [Tanacetum cinerariifolium]
DQAEDAFAEHRDDQCRQQRCHRDRDSRVVRNQLSRAVTGSAHRHVGGNGCHRKANGNNHRSDHHRRQKPIDETRAFDLHGQAQEGVDEAGRHHTAHGRCEAELALGKNDRGNEGEAGGQEYRHLTACHQLKAQRAQTCGEECDVRIEASDQRHQDQRAEGHEEHLRARQYGAPEWIVKLVLLHQASFCLVPKILSPASPRPGMM